MNKYNNLLTSVSWSTKDPKDAQILALLGVAHKLMDDHNKSSDKSDSEYKDTKSSTKVDPSYINYIPYWIWKIPSSMNNTTSLMEINNSGAHNTAL